MINNGNTGNQTFSDKHPVLNDWGKAIVAAVAAAAVTFALSSHNNEITRRELVKEMSETFTDVKEDMTFRRALETITNEYEEMKQVVKVEKEEIDQLKKENNRLRKEIDDSDKISRAEAYAGEGQYELAIPILASIENKSDEVNALLNNYTSIYEKDVLSKAELLADDGDYEEAKRIIDDALKVVPNSKVLSEERKRIDPKYLNKVANVVRSGNITILGDKDSVTIFGKKYNQGFKSHNDDFAGQFLNTSYSSNITYSLDGNYKQLSGIVGHIDFSGEGTPGESDAGQVYSASVKIWGTTKDKETRELGSFDLSPEDSSYEFKNISVDGIDILEFNIECEGNSEVGVVDLRIR